MKSKEYLKQERSKRWKKSLWSAIVFFHESYGYNGGQKRRHTHVTIPHITHVHDWQETPRRQDVHTHTQSRNCIEEITEIRTPGTLIELIHILGMRARSLKRPKSYSTNRLTVCCQGNDTIGYYSVVSTNYATYHTLDCHFLSLIFVSDRGCLLSICLWAPGYTETAKSYSIHLWAVAHEPTSGA